MMVMDNYYHHKLSHQRQHPHTQEMLWNKINALLLSYLDMEESPEKIEHKSKLEDCIHRYLCVSHHNQKFECTSTPQVLHESARTDGFSGYKAALGWDAIGRYAANLLTRPWRREYRQIKLYSGFYKHEVESNLVGAEAMFIEMGYKLTANEILKLSGPPDPDRLKAVSLDAIMAYVECQILKEVWEEVNQVYSITWMDVLSLRETHAGSPQETINALIYMQKMQTHVEHKLAYPVYPVSQVAIPAAGYSMYPPAPAIHSCCGGYFMQPPYTQTCNCNLQRPVYRHHGVQAPGHHLSHVVPTGQLIEVGAMYDQPDGSAPAASTRKDDVDIHRKLSQFYINDAKRTDSTSERDEVTGTPESWDYVYRNLESQGYSKDLGERGDLLQEFTQKSAKCKNKEMDGEKQMKRERRESRHSYYDNVSDKKAPKAANSTKSSALPTQTNGVVTSISNGVAQKPVASTSQAVERWHCPFCTYLNASEKDVCEICSKSRNKPHDDRLQVGGPQCEACTFVNSKEAKICTMCQSPLNNSPTYI